MSKLQKKIAQIIKFRMVQFQIEILHHHDLQPPLLAHQFQTHCPLRLQADREKDYFVCMFSRKCYSKKKFIELS